MKDVTIDTDPRPVEAVVTGEGGMERRQGDTYLGVNLGRLAELTELSYIPEYQTDVFDTSSAFNLRAACAPIIMPPPRCRSVLMPIEGI